MLRVIFLYLLAKTLIYRLQLVKLFFFRAREMIALAVGGSASQARSPPCTAALIKHHK